MGLFFVWFWLMVGNCAYQFFGPLDWSAAFDHSYFQGIAIGFVWFVSKVRSYSQSLHNR